MSKSYKYKSRGGFTLLELLVSVAIFSGIIVLALGAFARTASSSFKTAASRERTQAVRSVADRITNDFRYLYDKKTVLDTDGEGCYVASIGNDKLKGFRFNGTTGTCLEMLLLYPGTSPVDDFIWKRYMVESQIIGTETRTTLTVKERRNCSLVESGSLFTLDCPDNLPSQDLISDRFSFNPVINGLSTFSGLDPIAAEAATNVVPFLKYSLSVKPVGSSSDCDTDASSCYTVSTTLSYGGIK